MFTLVDNNFYRLFSSDSKEFVLYVFFSPNQFTLITLTAMLTDLAVKSPLTNGCTVKCTKIVSVNYLLMEQPLP